MSTRPGKSFCLGAVLALGGLAPFLPAALADDVLIFSGATPASAEILAQSQYVKAQGEYLKSWAIAREINARAVEQELKNWVTHVDAYFKRREINREARAKEEQWNYAENEERRQAMVKRRMEKGFQDLIKSGDLSQQLNWLLRELSGPTLAYQYLPQGQSLTNSKLDLKLLPRDLDQIVLTDGGKGNSRLVYRASEGKVLETRWPLGLRGEAFDNSRQRFEQARDKMVGEIRQRKGDVTHDTRRETMQALETLFETLEQVYTKEVRSQPAEFLEYNTSKNYLRSLLAGVHRALSTNDPSVFDGSLKFQGDSLVALIQHMYQNGAIFAPAQPGGEGVYEKLFAAMRNLYLNLGSEKADADFARSPADKEGRAPADADRVTLPPPPGNP